jgi:putative spermidine/putrescine transport system substrate-binding protein
MSENRVLSPGWRGVAIGTLALLSACAPPPPPSRAPATSSKAAAATSASDLGGMEALVAEARKEKRLNVIALPPDWANYGEVISAFRRKYGITVDSLQPEATSQDEINAAKQLRGTERSPDVFELGPHVALANVGAFAPYKVRTWKDIPDAVKEPTGRWFGDYAGYMSIGYDAGRVRRPTGIPDLLGPEYKGKVTLRGDPTQAGAGFGAVVAAALATGGSADDIGPGVRFFARLKKAGNLLPVDATTATIESGETPVAFNWDFINTALAAKMKGKVDWRVEVPRSTAVGSYYFQAINKDAVHPAAARLWEEFLYSDEGQNLFRIGFTRPVREAAMAGSRPADSVAGEAPPRIPDNRAFLTVEQTEAAKRYLAAHWKQAVG